MKTRQRITSAATSRKQVPAIVRRVADRYGWAGGTTNLDLGGGKWDLMARALEAFDVRNVVLDPYNRSQAHNDDVRALLSKARGSWEPRGAHTCTLSNVLNVVREPAARRAILEEAYTLTNAWAILYVTVYEGDKSSRGRRTRDGWQANRLLKNYAREIRKVWPNVRVVGGILEATK